MEHKFRLGDKVRVVKATLDCTEHHVGLVGVVVGFNWYELGDGTYTKHECPRVFVDDKLASYWHEPHGLELVEAETPKPTPQKLNSQYCLAVNEMLQQTSASVVDMMCLTHDKIYYADLNSLHTELIRCRARIEDTARWLERQEREALSRAAREAVTA